MPQQINRLLTISTHTLTWSVTLDENVGFFVWFISTHTLTWSVTMLKWESDLIAIISTHTLTWSVTWLHWIFFPYHNNFNSHAHVERDNGLEAVVGEVKFQLTRSRGA